MIALNGVLRVPTSELMCWNHMPPAVQNYLAHTGNLLEYPPNPEGCQNRATTEVPNLGINPMPRWYCTPCAEEATRG